MARRLQGQVDALLLSDDAADGGAASDRASIPAQTLSRRLRSSGAHRRMDADRGSRRPMTRRLLDPMPERDRRDAAAPRPIRSSSVWVTRQCRLRQDLCADGARAAAAAGGVRPEEILCLTYTKAAAAEMRERVSARLGEWAVLQETELDRRPRRSSKVRRRRQRCCCAPARCLPMRSKRPAASRSTPSTPSAKACCTASRSKPACRSISPSSRMSSATA